MQLHFSVSVSFFIISITLYQIPICFCVDYEAPCSSSFDCGNIKNISYPFWRSERPEYCGYPGFKLDCYYDYAEITIMNDTYRVLQVSYSDYSLRVVRTDFWNNSCPTHFKNNSIDFTLFEYRWDSHNLTLYYDCPSPPSSQYIRSAPAQLNCSVDGNKVASYFLTKVPEIDAETGTCASTLNVPILESQVRNLQENSTVENLKAAIDEGFGLVWEADNGLCNDCRKSGGLCGYKTSSSEFTCYCRDGPVPSTLEWKVLYQVAIGIACGLEYLHRGCNTRILHLDIKPQSILLDEEFSPKISDFGLAKICQKRESIVSVLGTRGTIGFIAPELFNRAFGGVSHKADVYSYGMLVLEMVGGRKNYDSGGSQSDEQYFPDWIYKDLEHGKHPASSVIITVEDDEMVRKMTLVSLWCIQTNPFDRPAMSKVVEMLEGPLQSLSVPPKPSLQCLAEICYSLIHVEIFRLLSSPN